MGFVKRYWQEAEEKKIPHYHRVVIVELQTGSARVQRRGLANLSDQQFPELPLEFSTYEEAFAWVERKLTPRAADIATADGEFCKCGWSLERHGGMNCLYRDAANA